jgi:low temperature requirement protein LtrA
LTEPEPEPEENGGQPLRVSTLELFFDLVFVFAITQLTGILAHHDLTVADGFRVLLVFGVLWWMYGGYVWLSTARTPSQTPERLLMLVGMAGFLIMALAIPEAFGRDGVALGIGYLIVVLVHGWLYQRVNRNIARVMPFNLLAAALVIVAGIVKGPAGYVLWALALAAGHPYPRPVLHLALAFHRAARRAGHHRVRRIGGGHRDRRRGARGDGLPGPVGRAGAGAVGRAVVGLLRRLR